MSKYPGRIISATPPTVSLSEASGVWTLEEAAQYQEAGTWPVAVPGIVPDPNFNQTVLLLHGDGTNGAQNNTFLDGSTNNFTITRNGNTTQGTFSPFSVGAGEFSNFFGTTNDALTGNVSLSTSTSMSTFTVEGWIYPTNFSSILRVIGDLEIVGSFKLVLCVSVATDAKLILEWFDGASKEAKSTGTLNANAWNWFAVVVNSNSINIYVNSTTPGQTGTTTLTGRSQTSPWAIGRFANQTKPAAYFSNLRWSSGIARTISSIPTAPYSSDADTTLLTCQSNRFVDNSGTPKTITVAGSPRVTPFSPFAPSAAYDPAVNGGSGYFDGTGDYLTTPSGTVDFSTNDFCIEAWVYFDSLTATTSIFGTRSGDASSTIRWSLLVDASASYKVYFSAYSSSNTFVCAIPSDAGLTAGQWYHVAATRDSSDVIRLFVNGVVQSSTVTSNAAIANSVTSVSIGFMSGSFGGTGGPFKGWMSGIRIVNGSAVYTSNFTPAGPLTAITNTSLLLNFTNAGIFDNTGKNNLETVADAQIDTGTKKYGTGSMEFDGTGDWLLMAHNPDQQLGTGNFTIEFWVYLASGDTGSARGLVAKGTSNTGWLVSLDSSQKVVFTYTSSTITSSGAITTNAWNHIAVVREGTGSNQTKIYIGGTNDGTGTVSTDFNQTSVMYVGCNRTAGDPMKGFIDDLRVTKGVARYTGTFTPPTSAFQDQ
jgi:hypothetical protein